MNITEKLIEDVREYLCDHLDEARDYLEEMGEDWVRFYTLDELYNDYCGGDLVELIDMFCESSASASDYEDYYVYEGDVRDACDIDEDVEYTFSDDYWVERLIDYAESGKVNASSALLQIIQRGGVSWDEVSTALQNNFDHYVEVEYGNIKNTSMPFDEFVAKCICIVNTKCVLKYLCDTKFFGIGEERYSDVIESVNSNSAWLYQVGIVARKNAVGGVPFEKGIEIYLKQTWFAEGE